MTKKKTSKKHLLILLSLLFLIACSKTTSEKLTDKPSENVDPKGSNYYVDSANGDDKNTGLSSTAAWKTLVNVNSKTFSPRDSILLKKGSSWEGNLALKGSGKAGFPIVVSSYGTGAKPHIMGNGKIDHVLLLENVDYWEINNIEISNNTIPTGNRTGIMIRCLQPVLKKHFRITNTYIHDIMGDYSFEMRGKNTGGIAIMGGPDTKFDDILIENCEIGNINRVGIYTNLTDAKNATKGKRPFTNLVIRNNKIHHCAGDGAIIRYAYRPIISHNTVYETHNGPEELVEHGVALWSRSTDEALFEYNEVYNTRGGMDGQAFDADLDSYRTIVQYNYSHDNEGGFMLVYGSSSDAIVRYNISVNDGLKGKHIFDFPVWTNPRGSGIFHNNTVVIPANISTVIADEALETARFYNNIFYNLGSGKPVVRSGGKTGIFKNNVFVGYTASDIPETNPFLADPLITAPLTVNLGFNNTQNFKLKNNSPYLDKGIVIKSIETGSNYWLPDEGTKDFGGKAIVAGKIPMGAYLD
jgi:hypothetical protein